MNSTIRGTLIRQFSLLVFLVSVTFSAISTAQESDTENAQTMLNTLGYEVGPADGVFGPKTESALRDFQKDQNIPVTGLLDKQTEILLDSNTKKLNSRPTNSDISTATEQINTDQEAEENTSAPDKGETEETSATSATGPLLDTDDWINIALIFFLVLFLLWTVYRTIRWIKRGLITLLSKLFPQASLFKRNKNDIQTDQFPETDRKRRRSKEYSASKHRIQKTNQNPTPVTHDSSGSYLSEASYASTPSRTIEDNRSNNQTLSHTVEGNNLYKIQSSWVPSGKRVNVKGFNIDGLVYIGTAPRDGRRGGTDKAFIDPALSVGKVKDDWAGQDLNYWPNYSQLSPRARATYLNWLSNGRSRVVNPGYMFLYFYGLERRYFRDTPTPDDRENIIIEVARLRNLFHENRSASNYLGIFLDAVSLPEDFSAPPEVRVGGGLPLSLKVGLARRTAREENISSDWLLSWYMASPGSKMRTAARRCPAEFKAMFKALFEKDYPNGMWVEASNQQLKATYESASGQFETDLIHYIGELPDISSTEEPLSYAKNIVDSATESLSGLSRLLGKDESARATLVGHSLLPTEIRDLFPCEEMSVLRDWSENVIAQGGLINVMELIEKLTSEKPDKLTRKRLTDASDTLLTLGVGVAPDPRFALRAPKESEPVILFDLPQGTQKLDVSDSFRLASLKLGATTLMAQSDNEFSDTELAVINSIVTNANELNKSEQARLSATVRWMQAVPPDMTTLRRKIRDATLDSREIIANLAIEVVVSDGDASNEEIQQLEKLYKAMELDPSRIHSVLHTRLSKIPDEPVTVQPAETVVKRPVIPAERVATESGIELDLEKIKTIDNNTRKVSALLNDIFSDQNEDAVEEHNDAPSDTNTLPGLSPELTALAKELATQDYWSEEEFQALASQHGVMPAGAVEAINEWSFNSYDRAYLDEYNGYDIDPDIAAKIGD